MSVSLVTLLFPAICLEIPSDVSDGGVSTRVLFVRSVLGQDSSNFEDPEWSFGAHSSSLVGIKSRWKLFEPERKFSGCNMSLLSGPVVFSLKFLLRHVFKETTRFYIWANGYLSLVISLKKIKLCPH